MGFCLLVKNPKVRNLLFGWSPHTPYTPPLYSGKKSSKRTNSRLSGQPRSLNGTHGFPVSYLSRFWNSWNFSNWWPRRTGTLENGSHSLILPVVRRRNRGCPDTQESGARGMRTGNKGRTTSGKKPHISWGPWQGGPSSILSVSSHSSFPLHYSHPKPPAIFYICHALPLLPFPPATHSGSNTLLTLSPSLIASIQRARPSLSLRFSVKPSATFPSGCCTTFYMSQLQLSGHYIVALY